MNRRHTPKLLYMPTRSVQRSLDYLGHLTVRPEKTLKQWEVSVNENAL